VLVPELSHPLRNRKIPRVDDVDEWSVWCIRVRPGHRGEGVSHRLLAGAVEFARDNGALAIEGYPVDNQGKKVDLTMAYVGTRALFERAGFAKAADTESVLNGFPRVLMRLELR
jgi:GNAT superfamily N-acetyltransferase